MLRDLGIRFTGRVYMDDLAIVMISDDGILVSKDLGDTWRSWSFAHNPQLDDPSYSWRVMEQLPFANYGNWTLPFTIK